MGILDFIPLIGTVLDRVIPDPAAAAEAKLKVLELAQKGELGQLDINKVEAASTSLFVAGWRPFIGWVCGAAFAYKFILAPFIVMLLEMFGVQVALPVLEFAEVLPILLGMLGLGTLRTVEKVKGVSGTT